MAHKHATDPENMASECFTACRSTGGGFCNRRYASYFGGDISSFGSENVKGVGWLSEPPQGQPKLRELQAIRAVVLLHGCRGSHQSGRLVQALGEKVGSKLVTNSRYSRHSGEAQSRSVLRTPHNFVLPLAYG
jgi:hypothetical protein